MIQFRCWYCGKRYAVPEHRIGERLTCSCKYLLQIPKRNDGNCRVKTLTDWLVEAVVYGGGGGLLGLGLAMVIIGQWSRMLGGRGMMWDMWPLMIGLPVAGFLFGLFGGERGVNWIGQMIRDREQNH